MPRGSKDGSIVERNIKRSVKGKEKTETRLYVRVRYTDAQGVEREKKRRISQRSEAPEVKRALYAEVKKELVRESSGQAGVTFKELADYYETNYLVAPSYVGPVKVKGLRSYRSGKSNLKALRALIPGHTKLTAINYDYVSRVKSKLLHMPVVFKRKGEGENIIETRRERGIVSVHRHLQMLRRMFSIANTKGWMGSNPFRGETPLISTAEEEERMLILSRDEESKLLAACEGKREGLRPALIVAVETALREGEQFTLTRPAVNLEAGIITVLSFKGKRRKVRHVPITARARAELAALLEKAGPDPEAKLFPHRSARRAFRAACAAVGLDDLRWHDLRHTAITRMLAATKDPAKVMKISGHDNWKTFLRYVTINAELAREISAMMGAHRGEVVQELASVN